MLSAAPHGEHIAYEPIPSLCQALRSKFPTVDIRQVALSNQTGEDDFVHVKHQPSRSGLRRPDYTGPETEILRTTVSSLDATLEPQYVPSLIKVDVEGAEQHVLEGARETILKYRPVVVFEHDRRWAAHYDTTSDDIYRLLSRELGLRIFDLDGCGPYSLDQFNDVADAGTRWNFFARH
jgi:FkbM family methyltransferase